LLPLELANINLLTFVGACTTQWIILIEICSENAKKHWEIMGKLYIVVKLRVQIEILKVLI